MSHSPFLHFMHSLHHSAERKGQHERALGIALIYAGVFLIWIPIIGLPMIGIGIYKAVKRQGYHFKP